MKISYNWLSELAQLTLKPQELAERLTMVGLAVESIERHGDDHLLDIDLTSNRPDALSHLGVAREAAIICGTALKPQVANITESDEAAESAASIEIHDAALCPRYAARVVRGVKVGPSPKWLVDRLEALGQRSVNNIADISNYVMFEMGQPTHAFDLNLLHGKKIIVRRPAEGEQMTTLDGVTRELASDHLIIADADHPVAIAGVMGGEETEISERTTDVLIESAYFNPASIRQTAKALGMDTEASYRFARGADFDAQVRAADRVAQLVAEIAGGQILKGVIDVYPNPITRDQVRLRVSRVKRLTGLEVSPRQALDILRALEFEIVGGEELYRRLQLLADLEEITVIPPSFRVDIFREEDLVEEVARHAGYDLVDTTLPAWSGTGRYLAGEDQRRRIRLALTTIGFDEAYTFSFVNGERDTLFRRGAEVPALLANPIDVNQNEMRSSLVTGLLESMQHNFNQGHRDVKLFELGRIFEAAKNDARPSEREVLGLTMSGAAHLDDWRDARQIDFYDLAGAVEAVMGGLNISGFTIERARVEYLHPGQSAVLIRDGEEVARYGRLHPRIAQLYKFRQPVYVAEIEFARVLELPADEVRYSALPRHPASSRDVSMLVPDTVMWAEIERAIKELSIAEIVDLRVFDVYAGKGMPEGMRSLAFRVTYRSAGRTLTDEEVAVMHERVRELMVSRFGAQLR